MQSSITTAGVPFVHVVGPDIDRGLLQSLHVGDYILAEINGKRLFEENPIASEHPWEITDTDGDSITIAHPAGHQQKLEFNNLAQGPKDGPAVFLLRSDNPSLPHIYVILQLISHKSDLAGLHKSKYRWFNKSQYEELFSDPIIKRGLLEKWCLFFGTFSEKGWGHKSFKRFALRAGITTDTIRAFRNNSWEEINVLSNDTLLSIAAELELLPILLQLSQMDFLSDCKVIEK